MPTLRKGNVIPCLSIPVLNRPDLLRKCVDSIDYPVGELLIVKNSDLILTLFQTDAVKGIQFHEPGKNLGFAGSVNAAQDIAFNKRGFDAVLICGNDIEWFPGDLEKMWQAHLDFPAADFVFGNHSYSNFMILRSGFEKVGMMDESFFPAYLEDSAHWQTIRMTGAKAIHAAGLHATHEGSATIKSDPHIRALSDSRREKGWDYYSRRFGCPKWSHGKETFEHPFNDPSWPPQKWVLDKERLRLPHYFPRWPL